MGDVTARWLSERATAIGVPQADATEMMNALRAASHFGDRRTLLRNVYNDAGLRERRAAEFDLAGTDYLLDLCTDAEWRASLQVKHKRHEKEDELIQVREGFYDIVRETLARVNATNIKAIIAELHALREHTNCAFKRIQDTYACVGTKIDRAWTIVIVSRKGTPTGGRGGLSLDDGDGSDAIVITDDDEPV
jgi:hypothetical protein